MSNWNPGGQPPYDPNGGQPYPPAPGPYPPQPAPPGFQLLIRVSPRRDLCP